MRTTLLTFLTLACTTSDPCPASEAPTLAIGLGEDGFEDAEDGADALLVHGPQGGYHLELGLEASGLSARDRVPVRFTGTVDGEVLATSAPFVSFLCDPVSGTSRTWGMRLIYDAEPEDLDERDTLVTASLDLPDGSPLETSLRLHIVDPEIP